MPRRVIEYRGLLISPSDVDAERTALAEVVDQWNAQVGSTLACRIELVRWETHAAPDASGEPQKTLNHQIVDDCDLGIAVFWARLGSPTSSHASGSLEEIDRLLQRGVRVLVYFSTAAVPQEALGDDQFAKLQAFKADIQQRGLVGSYDSVSDLREKVQLHLTSAVTALLERDRDQPTPTDAAAATTTLTAPVPDVRVRVTTVVMIPSPRGREQYIRVEVQNHSPIPVFISGLSILLTTGKGLYSQRDVVTHEYQRRRTLQSGESFQFFMDGPELLKSTAIDELDCVVASDDVGRQYRSSTEELRKAARDFVSDGVSQG